MQDQNISPAKRFRKRFFKNSFAVFGLLLIFIAIIISFLGYLIMPDSSPDANEMHLELSTLKPGSEIQFVALRKNKIIDQQSFISKWMNGKESEYLYIPVNTYKLGDSSIIIEPMDQMGVRTISYSTMIYGNDLNNENLSILEMKARVENDQIFARKYYLGTDRYGRDMLSRMILGTRVSLSVGFVAVIISMILGVGLGAVAGYYGGKIDALISWLINVIWSLPSLLLVIAISFALGKGFWQVFIAIGLSMWVEVARLVRGQIISIKNVEFVEAAKALGFQESRIIFVHIIPNIIGPLLVMASANFASAILLEAGLSFLGFGAQPPMPTWGGMVKEHYGYIIMDAAYLAIIPGVAIMLMVYAFNIFSSGLRDAFDMKSGNNITV